MGLELLKATAGRKELEIQKKKNHHWESNSDELEKAANELAKFYKVLKSSLTFLEVKVSRSSEFAHFTFRLITKSTKVIIFRSKCFYDYLHLCV